MKTCVKCGQTKPLEAFYADKGGKFRRRSECADCTRAAATARYQKSDPIVRSKRPETAAKKRSHRDYLLRQKFGISLEQYERLSVAQGHVCAVCGRPETATHAGKVIGLSVDHDHVTGQVRGLLCRDCNVSEGKLGGDPARIRALADYVEFHNARREKVA